MAPRVTFPLWTLQALLVLIFAAMLMAWAWALEQLIRRRPLLPLGAKPKAVPWRTGTVLLVFLGWVAVNAAISVAYILAAGLRRHDPSLSFTEQMLLVSLINGVLLVLVPALLALAARSWSVLRHLGIERAGLGRDLRAGALAFLLMTPVVYLIQGAAVLVWKPHKHPLEKMVLENPTAGIALLAFVSAVILAPAAEELVFRGIIQGWLAGLFLRPRAGNLTAEPGPDDLGDPIDMVVGGQDAGAIPGVIQGSLVWPPAPHPSGRGWGSGDGGQDLPPESTVTPDVPAPAGPTRWARAMPVVLTSAFFAAVHAPQWPAPIAIFLLSLGLGAVYQRTGSVLASFTMHALFNGLSTLMLFYATLSGAQPGAPEPPAPVKKAVPIEACAPTPRAITAR